jgi:Flp pilus assembly protein TadB
MRAPVDKVQISNGHGSGGLMSDVIHDAQRLIGLEIALAKQELKDVATVYAVTAGIAVGGGVMLLLAVLVALPTFVVVFVPWHWQAALVWVAAYLVLGLALVVVARSRFQVRLPKRTIESLKENKEWALRRVKSSRR